MSGSSARRGGSPLALMLLGLCVVSGSCAQAATPTVAPPPTPDALDIYIMMTARYTSPSVIATIYDMSADGAARIVRALQAIEAPPDLQVLHEQAVNAYQQIAAGKLLVPRSYNVLRSEAYFMIDWGIALLTDYWEQLEAKQR